MFTGFEMFPLSSYSTEAGLSSRENPVLTFYFRIIN